jgi:hypothetical protein
MVLNFMAFGIILRPFDIIYSFLVKFVVIWYIFSVLVCLDQEKSGNPGMDPLPTKNPLWKKALALARRLLFE